MSPAPTSTPVVAGGGSNGGGSVGGVGDLHAEIAIVPRTTAQMPAPRREIPTESNRDPLYGVRFLVASHLLRT